MASVIVKSKQNVTVRLIENEHTPADNRTVRDMLRTIDLTFDECERYFDIKFNHHLFVTLVTGDVMRTPEGDACLGVYHAGIQTVACCVCPPPKDSPYTSNEWLFELCVTAAHEVIHYFQDISQRSVSEKQAEKMATDIVTKNTHLRARKT